ncbi:MAG: hypothetical protein ACK5JS_04350, partial [Mangrovibacterium sp.]
AASARANAMKVEAMAYADGIVSDEEKRAIADAKAKADAAEAKAKAYADTQDTGIKSSLNAFKTETSASLKVHSDKIESKVSQASFDDLGNRVSSAESKIVQNASDITLSVSESKDYANNLVDGIELGGVNLALSSNKGWQSSGYNIVQGYLSEDWQVGEYYTITVKGTTSSERFGLWGDTGNALQCYLVNVKDDIWQGTFKRNPLYSYSTPQTRQFSIYNYPESNVSGSSKIELIQIERGNKATAWSLSPVDVKDEANEYADEKDTELASSLTITANKISLASQTIELTGNVLADAIEIGGDLKVGSRDSAAALEVSKSGAFYAKGSDGSSQMIVDSDEQLIELKSDKVADGISGTESGTTVIRMSSGDGSISVRGATSAASNSSTVVGNGGIFANTALQSIYPASTGVQAKASIVGLGQGNVATDITNPNGFVAGVYGRASTNGTAPAVGGYFEVLKASGLVLNTKSLSGNCTLSTEDTYVFNSTGSKYEVMLPLNPLTGQTIFFFQWWTGQLVVVPSSGQRLYDDSTRNDYLILSQGSMAIVTCIGSWSGYPTWLIKSI